MSKNWEHEYNIQCVLTKKVEDANALLIMEKTELIKMVKEHSTLTCEDLKDLVNLRVRFKQGKK